MKSGWGPQRQRKESGVPWLGRVPAEWDVVPALAVFRPKRLPNKGMVESRVLSLSYGRIVVKPPDRLHGLVPESFETYQVVEVDDIIVRTTDLQNDQTSLRVALAEDRGIITAAYMCLGTLERLLPRFGYRLLSAYDLMKIIYGYGSGLRQSLGFADIKRVPVPLPPREEQALIVRFLDYMDRRIRRYIRAKQKLIHLLDEQKQAIIHRAVTRGLDPNVRLKPSGVEWVGDVPEHWQIVPNRALLRLQKHLVGAASGDFVLLSLTKQGIVRRDMENPEGKWPTSFETYQEVCPGDLVFCLFDIDETPRAVGRSELHGMITGAYTRFSCDEGGDWVYLFYLAMDNGKRLKPLYTGLRKVITKSAFLSAKMLWPPAGERKALLEYVEHAITASDEAEERARREIDLVREYRTRLIADVVTGKLDVREAAARLPDEAAEPESPEELEIEATSDGEDDVEATPEEAEA